MQGRERRIVNGLLRFGEQIDRRETFPSLVPAATQLIFDDPYAFCLATCLDRGTRAEIIWTIPFWMKRDLGHLDPVRILRTSIDDLAALIGRLPMRPRYHNAAPRTIAEITAIVVRKYGGDASRVWQGRRAADVQATFGQVYGVGTGIASMAVLLLERGYGIRFADLDRRTMDIKPDVHTRRVLYRLGVARSTEESDAIVSSRTLNPSYPGALDFPLWVIGREWCRAIAPMCRQCPLAEDCRPRTEGD